jgi:hypothetical protein
LEHNELVTAHPCRRIDIADTAAQAVSDLPQQRIAGLMAEGVVGDLEAIEVDAQNCKTLLAAPRAPKSLINARLAKPVRISWCAIRTISSSARLRSVISVMVRTVPPSCSGAL